MQLNCEVEGNPPPDITWTHGRDKVNFYCPRNRDRIRVARSVLIRNRSGHFGSQIVGHSSNLMLIVSRESTGRYYCRAHVPGFPEIGAEAYVRVNGRPSIQRNSVQYGIIGDAARLECSAYSVPLPDRTSWSFNGQTIDSTHQDYSVRARHVILRECTKWKSYQRALALPLSSLSRGFLI